MPVNIGQTIPVREQPYADIVPDIVTSEGRGIGLVNAATFDTEEPLIWPANFDQLPIEEQERIKARYRFQGIKCRRDIRDRTIPISKETLDIP